MARSLSDILHDIEDFTPVDGNWLPLDRLLDELWLHDFPSEALTALFGVFERFPEEDGAGVFWSIVHGVETRDDYEQALLASLARCESFMGTVMLQRLRASQSVE